MKPCKYLQSPVLPSWFIFGTYILVPAYSKSVFGGVNPDDSSLPVMICHSKFQRNVFIGSVVLKVICLNPSA